jgi:hypothetical protein
MAAIKPIRPGIAAPATDDKPTATARATRGTRGMAVNENATTRTTRAMNENATTRTTRGINQNATTRVTD